LVKKFISLEFYLFFYDRTSYAGENLIYALAKESGKYKDKLRYPAEAAKYEKQKMDERGL
jgi:peptidoglycan-N-acetylglucosamine deacetylase